MHFPLHLDLRWWSSYQPSPWSFQWQRSVPNVKLLNVTYLQSYFVKAAFDYGRCKEWTRIPQPTPTLSSQAICRFQLQDSKLKQRVRACIEHWLGWLQFSFHDEMAPELARGCYQNKSIDPPCLSSVLRGQNGISRSDPIWLKHTHTQTQSEPGTVYVALPPVLLMKA